MFFNKNNIYKISIFFLISISFFLGYFLRENTSGGGTEFNELSWPIIQSFKDDFVFTIKNYGKFRDYTIPFSHIINAYLNPFSNNIESFQFFNKVPKRYNNLKLIQDSFLQCYFNTPKTIGSFKKLTSDENFNFSRYNFFLANYLLHKNKKEEAKKVITAGREKHESNLLIKQSENFIQNGKINKIKFFFNCKNLDDAIAEIFYIIANLYSTEKDYQLSNFYLKVSYFFNNRFTPNKTLLAENLFYQKNMNLQKKYIIL